LQICRGVSGVCPIVSSESSVQMSLIKATVLTIDCVLLCHILHCHVMIIKMDVSLKAF
jgi:hypothetical protein